MSSGSDEQGAGRKPAVLFMCLGNICRSPLAEGVFVHLLAERGLAGRVEVDSCGTGGWHAGEPPDPRAAAVAKKNGIALACRARQLDAAADSARFDLVIAMDASNRTNAVRAGVPAEKVQLLRAFDPRVAAAGDGAPDVPDPYYGGDEGFDRVYEMVRTACEGLLDHVVKRFGL